MSSSKSYFFQQNTCELDSVLTRAVNILTTNEFIKLTTLWTTGPWHDVLDLHTGLCISRLNIQYRFSNNRLHLNTQVIVLGNSKCAREENRWSSKVSPTLIPLNVGGTRYARLAIYLRLYVNSPVKNSNSTMHVCTYMLTWLCKFV